MGVEPIPDEPAAVADLGDERALVVADYHAGIESALRFERGIDVPSQAGSRRERLRRLVEEWGVDRLVVLGDFMHSIGGPGGAERGEIEVLLESLPDVEVTVVKGNHDGALESWIEGATITDSTGVRLGDVGFAHGHTWPAVEVFSAPTLCVAHEHPCVRLEDEVGGVRLERAWLRGGLDLAPFRRHDRYDEEELSVDADGSSLVVVPAFNDLVGGTWVNVPGQSFLAPFMPDALVDGEAYLLDGTRLGPYGAI